MSIGWRLWQERRLLQPFRKRLDQNKSPRVTIAAIEKMPGSEGFDNLFHQDNCKCKRAGTEINRMQRLQQLLCSENVLDPNCLQNRCTDISIRSIHAISEMVCQKSGIIVSCTNVCDLAYEHHLEHQTIVYCYIWRSFSHWTTTNCSDTHVQRSSDIFPILQLMSRHVSAPEAARL